MEIALKSKENSEPLADVIQMYIYEKTNSENTIEFDSDEKGYYITVNIICYPKIKGEKDVRNSKNRFRYAKSIC